MSMLSQSAMSVAYNCSRNSPHQHGLGEWLDDISALQTVGDLTFHGTFFEIQLDARREYRVNLCSAMLSVRRGENRTG